MTKRIATMGLCMMFTLGGLTLPAQAKHHKGEKPETEVHKHKGGVAKPAKRGADDPATHDAKDDKGKGGHGKDDPAGHK